jgi:two-component system NtrC family sensor kinase
MRTYITLVLFIACVQVGLAQKGRNDSLIAKLNTRPDNETRLPLLEQLSAYSNDFATIQKYANQGLTLSVRLNQPVEEEKFLELISSAEEQTADFPSSLATSLRGVQLSERLNDNHFKSIFLLMIGLAYYFEDDNIRNLNYAQKAFQVSSLAKDTSAMIKISSNLESFYIHTKKPDSARFFVNIEYRLVVHSKNSKIRARMGILWGDMGEVQSGLNHPDSALLYFYRSVPFNRSIHDTSHVASTENRIALAYLTISLPDSAKKYALDAYQLALKRNRYDLAADAAKTLSGLFEETNAAKSLFYYKAAMAAKDSVNGENKTKRFQAAIYAEQQRQADLSYAATNYQDKIRFFAAIAGLLLVTIVGLILWFTYKRQRKSNVLLLQQKQQVENTLQELRLTQQQLIQSEKMASLGELTAGIAHEIQNPLNFVNNFSEVSVELVDEMEEELDKGDISEAKSIGADLKENLKKIRHHGKRADFIVKGMLLHSRNSSGEKELTNINTMADEFLKLSYQGLRAKDKNFNAALVTNFDENLPMVNIAHQDIGRVLLNMFNNAFYAVNQKQKTAGTGYKPEVMISISLEKNDLAIKVKDNGNGIPDAIKDKIMQPFFTTKPTGEGTGLGLSLSYDIVVKGHGGNIVVNTKEGEFTEFIVTLPI